MMSLGGGGASIDLSAMGSTPSSAGPATERLRLAAEWMGARGWREKLAKRAVYNQSLFHHVLTELGFLESLADLLRRPETLALSDNQIESLLAAVLCHDAGKANPAWLEAVLAGVPPPTHVHREEVEEAITEWLAYSGNGGEAGFVASVRAAIGLHHRATQGAASVLDQLLHGGQQDVRWRELAKLVEGIDKTCSAPSVNEAATAARKLLGAGLDFAFHRVQVLRGVSTVFLHRACETVFSAVGWTPSLHFTDGTLYAGPKSQHLAGPTIDAIGRELAGLLDKLFDPAKLDEQVVGDPRSDMLPKPELFQLGRLEAYLRRASGRSKSANLRRQFWNEKEQQFTARFAKTLEAYWRQADWRQEPERVPVPSANDEKQAVLDRLVEAVPLDGIIRFFKAALLDDKLIDATRWPLSDLDHAAANAAAGRVDGDETLKEESRDRHLAAVRRQSLKAWRDRLKREYEHAFRGATFKGLEGVTNDPARNAARVIDPFLEEADGKGVKWLSKPTAERVDEFIRRLVGIVERSELPPGAVPVPLEAENLAKVLLEDIVVPGSGRWLDVDEHLRSYSLTAVCPLSNESNAGALGSGSDLGLKTDGHSNRLPVHGKTWKDRDGVATSSATRYELMLRRLILGRPAAKLLVLVPPVNLGAAAGRRIVDEVAQLEQEVALCSGERTVDPARRFSFGLTEQMARNWAAGGGGRLADTLSFRRDPQKAQADRSRLSNGLLEAFASDGGSSDKVTPGRDVTVRRESEALEALNEECGTRFATWGEAVEELYLGQSERARRVVETSEEVRARRRQALEFVGEGPARFVCQTPNLILVLLPQSIRTSQRESDANSAVRELFLSLLIADALSVGVALIDPDEALTFTGGEGAVRIPRNGALRSEVARVRSRHSGRTGVGASDEWLLPHEVGPWLRALAAVHVVAGVQGRKRERVFPERTALYAVLAARSAGALLRRVEAKTKTRAGASLVDALDALTPFLG